MRLKKILLLLAAVLLVCFGVLFYFRFHPSVYQKLTWLYGKKIVVTQSENLEGTAVTASEFCHDELSYFSSTGLNVASSKKVYDLHYVSPTMAKTGNYLLAYDLGGTEASVCYKNKKLYNISVKHPIRNATVSQDGFLTVISDEPGYQGVVTVYDRKGKSVYKVYSGEKFLLDAEVNGKKLAVCQYDATGDQLTSEISFYQLDEKEPYASYQSANGVLADLHFMSNGKLIAVGSDMTVGISSSNGKESWKYPYEGASLQSYSVSGEDAVALVLRQQTQRVVILKQNGSSCMYAYQGADIRKIQNNKSGVLFATTRDVVILNKQAYLLATLQTSRDIAEIHMADKGLRGAILYESGYDLMKLK